MKKSERKTWDAAMLRLEQSDKRLGKLQKAANKPEDINQIAARVIGETTGTGKEKNPAAVALGRLGGAKGGKARAAALSAQKRKAIAKKAAEARWKHKS